jgi:hypothetical protein
MERHGIPLESPPIEPQTQPEARGVPTSRCPVEMVRDAQRLAQIALDLDLAVEEGLGESEV